jgi:hypothetical protein
LIEQFNADVFASIHLTADFSRRKEGGKPFAGGRVFIKPLMRSIFVSLPFLW